LKIEARASSNFETSKARFAFIPTVRLQLKYFNWNLIFPTIALCLFCGDPHLSHAKKDETASVFIDSQTTKEYRKRKDSGEGVAREYYHVMEGRFFGGTKRDRSMDDMDFKDVVANLAKELRLRNYYPAREFEKGDLLIVVHWGATDEPYDPEDPQNNIGFGDEEEDALSEDEGGWDSVSSMLDRQSTFDYEHSLSAGSSDEVKEMLGFNRALDAKGMTLLEEARILSQVNTERYFMVLMAFDWQKKIKKGESDLLWTTRFSMESVGTNFADSMPAMMRAAQDFYGTHLPKMENRKTHYGVGDSTVGELEILETLPSEKKDEPKKSDSD